MTDDRKALADRLEVLSASLGHVLDEANYIVCVSGYAPDDRERAHAVYAKLNKRADQIYELESVIAALRQPSTDDAFRRGAEAMREAAAKLAHHHAARNNTGSGFDSSSAYTTAAQIETGIRADNRLDNLRASTPAMQQANTPRTRRIGQAPHPQRESTNDSKRELSSLKAETRVRIP